MKKLIFVISIILLLFVWFDQSRSIYKVGANQYVTVWKRLGGAAFVIPGRYSKPFRPTGNYIETLSTDGLELFTSSDMPKVLVLWSNREENIKIYCSDTAKVCIKDFRKNFKQIRDAFYYPNAKRTLDVKPNANLIFIDILEGYGTDKNGKL